MARLLGLWLVMAGCVTLLVYAWDKRAALRSRRRVPEKRLHLLALAGGAYGALVAMLVLRHKSQKAAFRLLVPLLAAAWTMAWLWVAGVLARNA